MLIQIEKSSRAPILHQVIDQIRIQCASGKLKPGERLPGMRALAAHLGIHRNTVLSAYDRLSAEGLLERRQGDGTYVSASVAPSPSDAYRDELRQEIQRLIRRSMQLRLEPNDFLDLLDEALANPAPQENQNTEDEIPLDKPPSSDY